MKGVALRGVLMALHHQHGLADGNGFLPFLGFTCIG